MTFSSSDRANIPPQLQGEPPIAYSHFLVYCMMGSARSLPEAARLCNKSESQISKLSARWQWQERVEEYDQIFLVDTAKAVRQKNLSRFSSFFEANITLSERAIKVSETILEALETTLKGINDPDYSTKINKVLSTAKAMELISRTIKNNQELHINLTGLEVLAGKLLEQDKTPKQPRDRYASLKERMREDREYEKTTLKGGEVDTTNIGDF
jgi:hypothetical protein